MYISCSIWTVARTNRGTAVLLKDEVSGKSLPLIITSAEAQSLLSQMNRAGKVKPNLYSYVNRLYTMGGLTLKRIEILPDGKGQTRGCLRAGRPGEDDFTEELTSCDALALALETGADLFVEANLFARKAVHLSLIELERKARKKKLEDKLSLLVEREEYEEAAQIRDRLIELDLE